MVPHGIPTWNQFRDFLGEFRAIQALEGPDGMGVEGPGGSESPDDRHLTAMGNSNRTSAPRKNPIPTAPDGSEREPWAKRRPAQPCPKPSHELQRHSSLPLHPVGIVGLGGRYAEAEQKATGAAATLAAAIIRRNLP